MGVNLARILALTILCCVIVSACEPADESAPTPGETKRAETSNETGNSQVQSLKKDSVKQYLPRKHGRYEFRDLIEAAKLAIDKNDYDAARVLAASAVSRRPHSDLAHFLLGKAEYEHLMGEDEKALVELQESVRLGTKIPDVYKYLANIYGNRKDYKKATIVLTQGIDLDPDYRELYKIRAVSYAAAGDFKRAEKDFDRSIELDPAASSGYFNRGRFYVSIDEKEKALADFNKVLELAPDNVILYKFRAMLLSKMGKHRKAISDLTKYMKLDAQDEDCLRLRGDAYARIKDYDNAIADYTEAIEKFPELARPALIARSKVYDTIGEPMLARADRKSARDLKEKPAEKPIFELK